MAERLIRIGRVSTVDKEKGMASVTYPDLDGSVTDELPLFSFTDEFKAPKVGSNVLVLHLSNGQTAGYVMGHYWNEGNNPPDPEAVFRKELAQRYGEAYIEYKDGAVRIHASKIVLDGEVSGTKDIKASGVSLAGHTHTGADGETSGPH
ncbi:MAG: hypothetical protein IJS41_03790 [Clostridia bacterium]|nr:hypothetical protein [Clostridia bacterium]